MRQLCLDLPFPMVVVTLKPFFEQDIRAKRIEDWTTRKRICAVSIIRSERWFPMNC